MKNVPCRYCESRTLGCHGRCDKYIDYKREHDALKERQFESDQNIVALDLRIRDRVERRRKRSR